MPVGPVAEKQAMSVKSKRGKWPVTGSRRSKKSTLQVVRGGRAERAGRADATPADLWRDLGDVATELVEKAGSVIEGPRHAHSSSSRRKKAA